MNPRPPSRKAYSQQEQSTLLASTIMNLKVKNASQSKKKKKKDMVLNNDPDILHILGLSIGRLSVFVLAIMSYTLSIRRENHGFAILNLHL